MVFTSKEICISYVEAKTFFFSKISDYTYELFNQQFLPTVSIYSSGNSSGEKRNLSVVTFAKGT